MAILTTWPRAADPFAQGAHSGLEFHFGRGIVRKNNEVFKVDAGVVALADDATNYVWVDEAGVVGTDAVGYAMKTIPLYTAVTEAGEIVEVSDDRSFFSAGGGGDGGGLTPVEIWPGFLSFPTPIKTAFELP